MRGYMWTLAGLLGCGTAATAEPCPEAEGTCWGAPLEGGMAREVAPQNVVGGALEVCSTSPMTGYFRDGECRTGAQDRGVHVVCATVNEAFLTYTASRGNDLATPRPSYGFPGLKPGDNWCLCADRWEEARLAGKAPRVVLAATEERALKATTLAHLSDHAAEVGE